MSIYRHDGGMPARMRNLAGWAGGLLLVAASYLPSWIAWDVLVLRPGSWELHVGAFLAGLPAIGVIAMVAPIVGYRRASALAALVPIWGWGRTYDIGAALTETSRVAADTSLATKPDHLLR